MKRTIQLMTIVTIFLSITNAQSEVTAMFTPNSDHSERPFEQTYKLIENAKSEVLITAYSWSQKGLKLALQKAMSNGAKVKMVLHPKMYGLEKKLSGDVPELESQGAEIKLAYKNMHEKFVVIDRKYVVNTSANWSGGAKTKYSENFLFFRKMPDIVEAFLKEFQILWNTSNDIFTANEAPAKAMVYHSTNLPDDSDNVEMYSSSMNFVPSKYGKDSKMLLRGRYVGLRSRKTWEVTDRIVKAINNAKETIQGNINHLFLPQITQALQKAMKRGVDVRLAVDNQEAKNTYPEKSAGSGAQVPYLAHYYRVLKKDAKADPPIRIKFYSHAPSPRYWYLNHNKIFLIDHKTSKPVLITGSHNFSKTAEHNQFDNQIFFRGAEWKHLYVAYAKEFAHLWNLNRKSGKIPASLWKKMTTPFKGRFAVHFKVPVSLSWNELVKLKKEINDNIRAIRVKNKLNPKFTGPFSLLNVNTRDCGWYDPVKDALGPNGCRTRR